LSEQPSITPIVNAAGQIINPPSSSSSYVAPPDYGVPQSGLAKFAGRVAEKGIVGAITKPGGPDITAPPSPPVSTISEEDLQRLLNMPGGQGISGKGIIEAITKPGGPTDSTTPPKMDTISAEDLQRLLNQ
jgi:hypothetical protein